MTYVKVAMAGLFALAVSGCSGVSDGNPNGSPYAGDPGGGIAVQPLTIGVVSYDPYAPLDAADKAATSPAPMPSIIPAAQPGRTPRHSM